MRRGFSLLLLLIAVALCPGADKKKKDPDKDTTKDAATGKDYQALADAHTGTGKLLGVGGSDRSLSLRVEYQVLSAKPDAAAGLAKDDEKALRQQQRILRDYEAALATRNPFQRAAKLQRLQRDLLTLKPAGGGNAFKTVKEHKDFDLQATPNVVVRWLELPLVFDDKGNAKTYTEAEKKELRGNDPALPGFQGSFDDLHAGQTVRVTLVKPKADKDKDSTTDDKKPLVSMIVIVQDGTAPSDPPPKGKKKTK